MVAEHVDVLMRLRGARQFQKGAHDSGRAIGGIQGPTNKLTGSMRRANKHVGIFRRGLHGLWGNMKGMVGATLGLAAGFLAWRGIESAVQGTEQLGENTLILRRALHMTIPVASKWAGLLQARAIQGRTLQMAFRALSGQIIGAQGGARGSIRLFNRMGLSWRDLIKMSPTKQIETIADALNRMPNRTARAYAGAKLFGRGWATLAPVLGGGSKVISRQLGLMDKYGVTLNHMSEHQLRNLVIAQRENQIAMMGLSVAAGQHLIPMITRALGWFNRFIVQMRTGKGAGGKFKEVMKDVGRALHDIKVVMQMLYRGFKVVWPVVRHFVRLFIIGVPAFLATNKHIRHLVTLVGHGLARAFRTARDAIVHVARVVWGALNHYLIKPIKWVINHLKAITHLPGQIAHGGGTAGRVARGIATGGLSEIIPHIPTPWQHGGTVPHAQVGLVGEKGPELVTLPRGAHVSSNRDIIAAIRKLAEQPIIIQTTLDGRVVTQGVARRVSDAKARL